MYFSICASLGIVFRCSLYRKFLEKDRKNSEFFGLALRLKFRSFRDLGSSLLTVGSDIEDRRHNLKAVLSFLIFCQLLEYFSIKKMQLIVTLIVVVIFAIFTLSSAQYMSGNNGWETVATNNAGVIDASKFAVDWYVQGGDAQFLVVDATKQV